MEIIWLFQMKANSTIISEIFNIWNSRIAYFLLFCIFCLGFDTKILAKNVVVLKSNRSDAVLSVNAFEKENTVYKIYSSYSLNRQKCVELKICVAGEDVEINSLMTSSSGNAVIYSFSSCNSLRVLNCEINALNGNGVKIVTDKIKGVVQNLFFNNNSISFNRMGIEIQNHGNKEYRYDGINICNSRFSMNTNIGKYGYGVSLSGYGRNVAISNCVFDAVNVGIEIVGFSDVEINSNHFDRISKKVIATSNKRPMSDISIKTNVANCGGAKLQFANTRKIIIERNEFNISMIEMIGCSSCRIAKNRLTANGHYAIMLDGDKQSTENNWVYDNDVFQQGDNWSVFRCYGVKSRGNRFENNFVRRANKKGVAHDQMKGASNNMFK